MKKIDFKYSITLSANNMNAIVKRARRISKDYSAINKSIKPFNRIAGGEERYQMTLFQEEFINAKYESIIGMEEYEVIKKYEKIAKENEFEFLQMVLDTAPTEE